MKKTLRLLIAAALALSLVGSFAVSAGADFSSSYKVDQTVSRTTVYSTTNTISNAYPSGSLPEGLSFTKDDHNIYIEGKPSQTGTFNVSIRVETDAGTVNTAVKVVITADDEYGGIPSVVDPSVSATPTPDNTSIGTEPPKITKHPTGETVEPGGTAKFIARADNATEFIWRIVSKDTTNTIPAIDAPGFFSGLKVSGTDSDTLVLSNIPSSMDGWSVECRFKNANGSSFTNGAVITVKKEGVDVVVTPAPTAKEPVINTQPIGKTQDIGTDCTLSVKAISPDDGTLYYQWYKSNDGTTNNITAIEDANDESFTPPQTLGTVKYFVAISNAKNGKESRAIYSELVSVTYTDPTVPTQPSQGTDNVQPTGTPVSSATPTEAPANNSSSGLTTSLIFFGATGVLALAALIGILIFLKKSKA